MRQRFASQSVIKVPQSDQPRPREHTWTFKHCLGNVGVIFLEHLKPKTPDKDDIGSEEGVVSERRTRKSVTVNDCYV